MDPFAEEHPLCRAKRFFPFCTWIRSVNRRTLKSDILAGITGAVIVLPQGVAFALIAGLPPEYGLYSAVVPVIVAALFGSSWHLISGPTTAISIVIFATVSGLAAPFSEYYISLVITMTFMVGLFQIALGIARMGALVNFVSHTVVVGFTAGAALLIITNQLPGVLGLTTPEKHSFYQIWKHASQSLHQTNLIALVIAVTSIGVTGALRLIDRRIPNMLIGLLAGSLIALAVGAEQRGVSFIGELPDRLPPLSAPSWSFAALKKLVPVALAIAMLGLMEAVSIARAIALKTRQKIDNNQEFIGQGLSNVVGSFFSSYASSGSFTRSGVNHEAGARTPLAAVFSALFLAVILLVVAPLTRYIPMPAMAGLLVYIGLGLIDWSEIRHIVRVNLGEAIILIVTFLATLLVELEFAIFVGVMLSLLLYLNRTSRPQFITLVYDFAKKGFVNIKKKPLDECPQLKILRIDGSLFFGAVENTAEAIAEITRESPEQAHLLIVGGGINFIDLAGCELLANEARSLRLEGRQLYLCSLKGEVVEVLRKGSCMQRIGQENIFANKKEAIRNILPRLDPERCRACKVRAFGECRYLPGGPLHVDERKSSQPPAS